MKLCASSLAALALAAGCNGTPPPGPSPQADALPEIELVAGGQRVAVDAVAARALSERVRTAIAGCNFSSETRPEIFPEPPAEVWKRREASSHLRLRHAADQTVDTHFGKLVYRELLLSVGQAFGPEPALAKTPAGVIGLKKCGYDDRFLGCDSRLARLFPPPAACPPGF